MPRKTLKNKKAGKRIFHIPGSPVPMTHVENTKKGITYKLPMNLLEPKNLLRSKQKDRINAAKLAEETRRSRIIEAERMQRERLESQARFAAMLRAERERQTSGPSSLLPAFAANEEAYVASPRRGPGARGIGATRTIPPNLLRLMRGNTTPKVPLPRTNNLPGVVRLLGSLTGNRTIRKANLLKAERFTRKMGGPTGKFWKKEGTNNSNSD